MFLMKRSLFAKILLSMLITTTVPLLITNYMSYHTIGRAVQEQLVELNQSSMAIKMSGITKYIHDVSLLSVLEDLEGVADDDRRLVQAACGYFLDSYNFV